MTANGMITPTTAETAKKLKDVIEAIERVSKLEGELQQQLGKSEPPQRQHIANELANAVGAREKLVDERRDILKSLNPQRP